MKRVGRSSVDAAAGGVLDSSSLPPSLSPSSTSSFQRHVHQAKVATLAALHILSFTMAADATLTSLSLQAHWYQLGGPVQLFGLAQGSYDVSSVIFAPILGIAATKFGYKPVLVATTLLNSFGNFLYAWSFVHLNPWMLYVGRLLAGIGSCNIAVAVAYLTVLMSNPEQSIRTEGYLITGVKCKRRLHIISDFNIYRSLCRIGGFFLPFAFFKIPLYLEFGGKSLGFFNVFTAPAWIAAGCALFATWVLLRYFVDVPQETRKVFPKEYLSLTRKGTNYTDPSFVEFLKMASTMFILHIPTMSMFYSTARNIFSLALSEEFVVNANPIDIWKPSMSFTVSSLFFFALFKLFFQDSVNSPEYRVCIVGMLGIVASNLCLTIHVCLRDETSLFFYLASIFLSICPIFYPAGFLTFYSKMLTRYKHVLGGSLNFFMGCFFALSNLSRIIGPLVGSLFLELTSDYKVLANVCVSLNESSSFDPTGCILENSQLFFPLMAGMTAFLTACTAEFFRRNDF